MSETVIRGYAAVFERPDLSGDRLAAGAFAASLKRHGPAGVRMLWHHDPTRPIGRWTRLTEDGHGLRVEGVIATGTRAGREAAGLIAAGALDGLSIGFRPRLARRETRPRAGRDDGGRRLIAVDLWEISLVSFPMQEAARVAIREAGGPGRPPPSGPDRPANSNPFHATIEGDAR